MLPCMESLRIQFPQERHGLVVTQRVLDTTNHRGVHKATEYTARGLANPFGPGILLPLPASQYEHP
ncbi:MAG: hypothetical protein JWO69_1684 [Thermoleophilia bacterium]|nr:hypothetical protein [Thermoleophilia bacterium]